MASSTITRFPNGISTSAEGEPLNDFVLPDMTKAHVYFEDFDYYTAADWTITVVETGAGSAVQALTNLDGGNLLLTNDNAVSDRISYNKVGESFLFELGKKSWFEARWKTSDNFQTDIVFGLQITDATPTAVSDGVYFRSLAGASTDDIQFNITKGSGGQQQANIGTLVADTFIRTAFTFDGVDAWKVYVDGGLVKQFTETGFPDDEEMTISFSIANNNAVANTMTVDYLLAAKER